MSIQNIKRGVRPEHCGSPSSGLYSTLQFCLTVTGIGAAMRIGPLGALYRDNLQTLATCVWESSLITHGTIHAAACAWAVAYTVQQFISGATVEMIRDSMPTAVSEQVGIQSTYITVANSFKGKALAFKRT